MKENNRGLLRSVGEVLASAMPEKIALHIKVGEIKERWGELVDKALASRSFPVMFEYEPDGKSIYLLVSASSPAAAQRVKMFSGRIISKLDELWRIEITGVRVKVI
ncbi:MAG: DUF721 domain-containing protein [Synergistaceae bacterium]|nr:DUF721 domain-containing protein [Synergistaceae bacterium]